MDVSPDDQPAQAFRCSSTDEALDITACEDPKSGKLFVLWIDIQRVFGNVKYIKSNGRSVPFLKDENFADQAGTSRNIPSVSVSTPADEFRSRDSVPTIMSSPVGTNFTQPLTQSMVTTPVADINLNDRPLTVYSGRVSGDTQLSLHSLQAVTPGQEIQQMMEYVNTNLVQLQNSMNENKHLQAQLVHMQGQALENQEKMKQMQEETLSRLAIIQNRVEAVLTQTYELHEYPIPRLFIVLPKAESFRNKITGLFSDHFRLYFLCECGTHTMTENTKTLHEIHMAKHEGYDLEKPTEFFERYGSYIQAMMYMIKFGISAAGIAVPPLANFKVVDGLDSAQKYMDYLKKNIGPLVDDTIKFLSKTENGSGSELTAYDTEFDRLEALEGADLRQLDSYLKIKDEGRVLGNLYRIVTQQGHVKWVCLDHYRASYREASIQQLREIVEVNSGKFIEQEGRIEVEITTNTLAKQFYTAMIQAHGIQELEITLKWDASMDELRSLADAVTKTNVARLVVNGSNFNSPTRDVINRNQRFEPILQLASNSRVQSLQLKNFTDFFARIDNPKMGSTPRLRTFSMDSGIPLKDKALKSFNKFLKHCPTLTTLELKLHHQLLMDLVKSDTLRKLRFLESIAIDCGSLSILASISTGKIQGISVTVVGRLDSLQSDDLKFIKQGYLTQLTITYIPQKVDEDRVVDILRHSPKLNHLHIKCQEDRCKSLANSDELSLHHQGLVTLVTSNAVMNLQNLESLMIDCERFSISTHFSSDRSQNTVVTIERLCALNADGIKFLQDGHLSQLTVKHTSQKSDIGQLIDIIHHSPKLGRLKVGCRTESCLAITNQVISARETAQQKSGSCLRTFQLMEEGFVSIDDDRDWDYKSRIQCHVFFAENSSTFDMRTWIRLQLIMPVTDEDPVYDFVRSYGYSIVTLNGQWTFSDHFAALLGETISSKDSKELQIERLGVTPYFLTTPGIAHLDNVIAKSQNLDALDLHLRDLDEEGQVEKGIQLMTRHHKLLDTVELFGFALEQWLPMIVSSFPTRNSLPKLVSMELGSYSRTDCPASCVHWIVTMLSTSTRSASSSKNPKSSTQQSGGLKRFSLKWVILKQQEWEAVIEGIDTLVIQQLSFEGSNFSQTELKLLVDRFPAQDLAASPLLSSLDIRDTDITNDTNTRALCETLQKKAPGMVFRGISLESPKEPQT
ncbi:hypothetical protein BGX31_005357 [Mortierella sp. GBA43]|nr:hypothetical protein BGX31_005357 [Mortierella sp. GBA43]